MTSTAVRRRLGCGLAKVQGLALKGKIRLLVLEGMAPRYWAEDVERVAAEQEAVEAR
jgi:hypothetical protein